MSAGSRCHLDDTGNMFLISTCSSYRCGLTLGMVFFRVGGLSGGCSVLVPQLPPTEQRHAHQAKWKSLGESMYGSLFLHEALQLASAFRVKPLCDPDCRISGDKLDGLMGSIVRVSCYLYRWKLHQKFDFSIFAPQHNLEYLSVIFSFATIYKNEKNTCHTLRWL